LHSYRRSAFFNTHYRYTSLVEIFARMQLSLVTIIFGFAAIATALPQDWTLVARQNGNRGTPSGNCCVANTNLKQDACNAANGQAGRCVPGGNNCEFPLLIVYDSEWHAPSGIISDY
jgi:hypothetical protein